ncbi:MAG TPA: hypothetical protein VFE96_09220, partial [Candidatus Bathyarchaeia archaeon]|nr:hypothetical protein [Candidatus Bathyarchaeia archaeon]
AKLVKFVIVTRFSKPLLGLIAFFLVYETVIGTLTIGKGAAVGTGFSYYAVGASIFFMTMSLLFGGLFIVKSDRDWLLTLPLSRRDLSVSLFIAQFLGYGITILFLYGFYVAAAGDLLTTIVLIVNLVILACVITSLGVISNILQTPRRIVLAVALTAWCVSSVFGIPFTPVSSFKGDFVYGSIALILLAAIAIPVALKELAYVELGSLRSLMRTTSSEYKKNMSFQGKSPLRAVYSYHLSFLQLVARMNVGGSTSYRAARVKTRTVLLISIIGGAIYLILTGFSPFGGLSLANERLRPAVFVLPVFMGMVVLVLMSQGTFSNERGWLAFTAMDPAKYLRHLLLARILSTLAIIAPFGVADIILAFMGDATGIRSAIVLLVTIPASSILATYILARLGVVYQVKEEGLMPGAFDLRQFLTIIPIYAAVGLIILSEYSLDAGIVIATVLSAITIILLGRASIWRGIAYRLTERGFV